MVSVHLFSVFFFVVVFSCILTRASTFLVKVLSHQMNTTKLPEGGREKIILIILVEVFKKCVGIDLRAENWIWSKKQSACTCWDLSP